MELDGEAILNDTKHSNLLTEEIPKYGPVAMLFYIPESAPDREEIIDVIRTNGGNIVKFHECFSYQLGPPDCDTQTDYYPAEVFSTKWIIDSVESGEILEKSGYVLSKRGAGLPFPFDKKKIQYTIREIIII